MMWGLFKKTVKQPKVNDEQLWEKLRHNPISFSSTEVEMFFLKMLLLRVLDIVPTNESLFINGYPYLKDWNNDRNKLLEIIIEQIEDKKIIYDPMQLINIKKFIASEKFENDNYRQIMNDLDIFEARTIINLFNEDNSRKIDENIDLLEGLTKASESESYYNNIFSEVRDNLNIIGISFSDMNIVDCQLFSSSNIPNHHIVEEFFRFFYGSLLEETRNDNKLDSYDFSANLNIDAIKKLFSAFELSFSPEKEHYYYIFSMYQLVKHLGGLETIKIINDCANSGFGVLSYDEWMRYIDNHDEYKDYPASWWIPLVTEDEVESV